MGIVQTILMVLEVFAAVSLIVLILLQQGKGADAGASFGGGSSGGVFGSMGASGFMSRATAYLATLFIVCTILLVFAFSGEKNSDSVLQGVLPTLNLPHAPVEAPVLPQSVTDGIPK